MRRTSIAGLALVCALGLGVLPACSQAPNASPEGGEAQSASQDSKSELSQPTDFSVDSETGSFTFNATDENAGYYFVRVYALRDGEESGDQVVSSSRINGGLTGELSGQIDLSALTYGEYHVNLMTYAPSGTDYVSPDPVTLTLKAGVGGKLERPEMLAMASGNQVELVLDWWTLCDYNSLQYLPKVKFSFYADEGLSELVQEETVDTHDLLPGMKKTPPGTGYIWGEARDASVVRLHKSTGDQVKMYGGPDEAPGVSDMQFGFVNDKYAFTLDSGTYYVTAQAISDYDFIESSDVSTPVVVTLTDEEPSSEFVESKTELYVDPMDDGTSIYANPGEKTDRVSAPESQETSVEIS